MASMNLKDVEAATKAMGELSPEQLNAAAEIVKEHGVPTQLAADEPLVISMMKHFLPFYESVSYGELARRI